MDFRCNFPPPRVCFLWLLFCFLHFDTSIEIEKWQTLVVVQGYHTTSFRRWFTSIFLFLSEHKALIVCTRTPYSHTQTHCLRLHTSRISNTRVQFQIISIHLCQLRRHSILPTISLLHVRAAPKSLLTHKHIMYFRYIFFVPIEREYGVFTCMNLYSCASLALPSSTSANWQITSANPHNWILIIISLFLLCVA